MLFLPSAQGPLHGGYLLTICLVINYKPYTPVYMGGYALQLSKVEHGFGVILRIDVLEASCF